MGMATSRYKLGYIPQLIRYKDVIDSLVSSKKEIQKTTILLGQRNTVTPGSQFCHPSVVENWSELRPFELLKARVLPWDVPASSFTFAPKVRKTDLRAAQHVPFAFVRTNPVNHAQVDRLRETRPSAGVSVAFFAIPIGVWERFG